MLFFLVTPEYSNIQSNIKKVKIHLENGIAEIFDQHQDLISRINNNIVEIEVNSKKIIFILHDAICIILTKGLGEIKTTSVYIYAQRVQELNSNISLYEMVKEYKEKNQNVERILEQLKEQQIQSEIVKMNIKLNLLKNEIKFLKKIIVFIKEIK
jgi:F0F1-type ATP synthase epsilon subunit